jgi:hypothetical protein
VTSPGSQRWIIQPTPLADDVALATSVVGRPELRAAGPSSSAVRVPLGHHSGRLSVIVCGDLDEHAARRGQPWRKPTLSSKTALSRNAIAATIRTACSRSSGQHLLDELAMTARSVLQRSLEVGGSARDYAVVWAMSGISAVLRVAFGIGARSIAPVTTLFRWSAVCDGRVWRLRCEMRMRRSELRALDPRCGDHEVGYV